MGRRRCVFWCPAAPLRWLVGGTSSELMVVRAKLMVAG
jgi:hypothetical protein